MSLQHVNTVTIKPKKHTIQSLKTQRASLISMTYFLLFCHKSS